MEENSGKSDTVENDNSKKRNSENIDGLKQNMENSHPNNVNSGLSRKSPRCEATVGTCVSWHGLPHLAG